MNKKILIDKNGPPSVMKWVEAPLEIPKKGEVSIKHTAVGLNYIDTYHRSGLYSLPLPAEIGMEGAGVITEVGKGVKNLERGDRVAYGLGPPGSYSDQRNIQADKLIKIPEKISDKIAAAIMLKGMTVEYLLERTYKVKNTDTVLFHAAAGGVGLIACQWLKSIGANIIGTVGNDKKARLAKEAGCDHTILYEEENFLDKVLDITGGKGVNVVYDGVGKNTALKSLECLSPLGMLVLFGNSSGNSPEIDPALLAAKGSLFLTRPTLMTYCSSKKDMNYSAGRVFEMLENRNIIVDKTIEYLLSDVVNAHEDLENRKTNGSVVLINDH